MMSLCTASLVNNAEDTETERGRGKDWWSSQGTNQKVFVLLTEQKSTNFPHHFGHRFKAKHTLVVVWELKLPRYMFKMGAIYEWSLGLILCITNTHEAMVPCDVM